MCSGEERNIGPHKRSRTDRNLAGVEKDCMEVDKYVLAKRDVEAIVDCDRRFNPGIIVKQLIIFFGSGSLGRERGGVLNNAARIVRLRK